MIRGERWDSKCGRLVWSGCRRAGDRRWGISVKRLLHRPGNETMWACAGLKAVCTECGEEDDVDIWPGGVWALTGYRWPEMSASETTLQPRHWRAGARARGRGGWVELLSRGQLASPRWDPLSLGSRQVT